MKLLLSLITLMFFASSVSYAQLLCEPEIKAGDTVLTYNSKLRSSSAHKVLNLDMINMTVKIKSTFNGTVKDVRFTDIYLTKGCVYEVCVGKVIQWGNRVAGFNRLNNYFIVQQAAGGAEYIYGLEDVL